jgi:hypothetical protein
MGFSFGSRARVGALAVVIATSVLLSGRTSAYTVSGPVWVVKPVPYVINTTNLDLPDAAVEAGVRAGAAVWSQQTTASIAFTFAGRSTVATNANDGVNVVMFRNASSGSAIATTYWWSNGGSIIDADMVFWDGAFQFFTGSTGCTGGFYIEDIAAHEFGHVLGLGHSTSTAATMYPSVAPCDMRNRTLDADDIAGVTALYPPSGVPKPPTGVRIVPLAH